MSATADEGLMSGSLICTHCGQSVPPGAFCGFCGAHLHEEKGRRRLGHFAASPSEHVLRTALISTLFPHLMRRHAHVFRETFAGGALLVLVLAALRLYTPALLLAAAWLPVLYLLYVHEAEVWERRPLSALLATFGVGLLLGFGYSLGFGQLITPSFAGTEQGPLLSGILLPVVAQLAMVVGPSTLLWRKDLDEALDGLSVGVMSAFGFVFASVVAGYWHNLTAPLVGQAAVSSDQILNILRVAIIGAVVSASTTGLVTVTLWLRRHGRGRGLQKSILLQPAAMVLVALLAQVGLGLGSYFLSSLLAVVALWALGAAALLMALRVVTHLALLEEGAAHVIAPSSPCSECHMVVPSMHFCPHCGAARSAAPKRFRPDLEVVR